MVEMQTRPVFQLSKALGCTWKNIERAHRETESAKCDLLALLKRELGERFSSEDANLVIFGSLGRSEWIDWQSDLDWTFLVDGQCKAGHFEIAHQIRAALKKECRGEEPKKQYRFAEPGPTGTFGNLGFSHQLIHLIGGQEDTNKNTTQRILLLLESLPIGDARVHGRVLRAIIHRYLDEETHLIAKEERRFKVPRFLVNDIVRFWRTMAVDFASKLRDRGGEGWGLRNAKLRMSRKLIFASGLLSCFSCNLDEELQAKISADEHDIRVARRLDLVHLENHLLRSFRQTPLDNVAAAVGLYAVDDEIAGALFSAYDEFLGLVADPDKRERLKKLRAEDSRQDSDFRSVQEFGQKFEHALSRIFFENPSLKPLTQKYGVF